MFVTLLPIGRARRRLDMNLTRMCHERDRVPVSSSISELRDQVEEEHDQALKEQS